MARTNLVVGLGIAALAALGAGRSAAGTALRLAAEARTGGRFVHLSDVLEGGLPAGALAERLARVRLGPAPEGEGARTITADEIRAELAKHGIGAREAVLAGADRVTVRAGGPSTIDAGATAREAVEALLTQAAAREAGPAGGTFQAELAAASPDGGAPAAGWLVRSVRRASGTIPGAAVFRVEGTDGDGAERTVDIETRVYALREALVLRRAVSAGQTIPPEAVEARTVRTLGHEDFLARGALGAVRARNTLEKGTVLTERIVRLPPVVQRRDPVTLVYRSRGLQIVRSGVAQDDGAVGETIGVELPDTRQTVPARVTGPGGVEISAETGGGR